MKRILGEIQDGTFARDWLLENRVNAPHFKAIRRKERGHLVETVGRGLRKLMSWINSKEV
jgi:ketol-acid reductoisomerase